MFYPFLVSLAFFVSYFRFSFSFSFYDYLQFLHGFSSTEEANDYLSSDLFKNDVYVGLKNLWKSEPSVRIYSVA
ncbi:hypothetical protein LJC08_02275 [Methanimicrococcus sp. OttesenSCG-928-J09]|nr:hypothetical protein [Methanimicrococcus sp. OttesenSCG-928-J09]